MAFSLGNDLSVDAIAMVAAASDIDSNSTGGIFEATSNDGDRAAIIIWACFGGGIGGLRVTAAAALVFLIAIAAAEDGRDRATCCVAVANSAVIRCLLLPAA